MSIIDRIRAYLRSQVFRANVRYSVRTFAYAFLAVLVPGLFGFLHGITAWAEAQGQTPFPDATSLGYLAVSALVAGTVGVVNLVGRVVEDAIGKKPLR